MEKRIEKVATTIDRRYPQPLKPGFIRVIKVPSSRVLDSAELDKRSAAIPRKPGEHRILINVVQVKSRVRQPAEIREPAMPAKLTSPATKSAVELELEVRRLERRKAELLAARRLDDRKREARIRQIKRNREEFEEAKRR